MTTTVARLLTRSSNSNSNSNSSSQNNNSNSHTHTNIKTANTTRSPATTTTAKPQTQHCARRRPLQIDNVLLSWRTLLLLAALMGQLHEHVRPGDSGDRGGGLAMAAPSHTAQRRQSHHTRLHKRHDHPAGMTFKQRFQQELSNADLDWSNGCRINWKDTAMPQRRRLSNRCAKHKKVLRDLRRKTKAELNNTQNEDFHRTIDASINANPTPNNRAINTSGISESWALYNDHYSFLPRVNISASQLPLRRAHADMQFYVAAFSYMRHAQLYWDYGRQRQSVLSAELMRLRTSARAVLCIIEDAINKTSLLYSSHDKLAHKRSHKQMTPTKLGSPVKTLQREVMEKQLANFRTPLVQLHHQAVLTARNEPTSLAPSMVKIEDAMFLKFYYQKYLQRMQRVLGKQAKKHCKSKAPKSAKASRAHRPHPPA